MTQETAGAIGGTPVCNQPKNTPPKKNHMRHWSKFVLAGSLLAAIPAQAVTEITYWLWDENQPPAYQACADAFEKQNPDIKIKITQTGWMDYWNALSTAFVSGTAPDVITDHLARYPEFIQNNLLVDLTPLIARDNVPTNIYFGGLVKVWGRDGKQYGLPKDWDTIAVVYNKAILDKAGIDPNSLSNLTWNPKDGGSFGQLIAKLSVDANGKTGLDAGFDPKNVKQYGLIINGAPDAFGQVEWSHLAVSNGFKFYDGPWANHFYYDDPKLAETIQWIADMELKKGLIVPAKDVRQAGPDALFAGQKGALAFLGSWDVHWCQENCKFDIGFALLPAGPVGRRTMFNGLADSIWVGSKHQEEAWKWVKFLASPEAQKIVGSFGVVFPAVPEGTELAKEAMAKKGLDVSAYVNEANDPNATFLFPITDHATDVQRIMREAFDSILLNGEDVSKTLKSANDQVNALFD
jgi:multiple sugar transport system substrate-binding protein